jgi:hypothetical protein
MLKHIFEIGGAVSVGVKNSVNLYKVFGHGLFLKASIGLKKAFQKDVERL